MEEGPGRNSSKENKRHGSDGNSNLLNNGAQFI